MNRTAASSLLLAALVLGMPARAATPEDIVDNVGAGIWHVQTANVAGEPLRAGSAVVIAPGRLVTSCRVLAQAASFSVRRGKASFAAELEFPDVERDLCQLRAAGFDQPPVPLGRTGELKAGARVYAISNPRGQSDASLGEGLVAELRRGADEQVEGIQTTIPASPAIEGGGLFDARGRLVGIVAAGPADAPPGQASAAPVAWLAELPARGQVALSAHRPGTGAGPHIGTRPRVGRSYEYRLEDRSTRLNQKVVYRVDRIDGDQVLMNQGGRIEKLKGDMVSVSKATGGEFDLAIPPTGWVPAGARRGLAWNLQYRNNLAAFPIEMDLRAQVQEESTQQIAGRDMRVLRVSYEGYTARGNGMPTRVVIPYKATAWYAPEMGRVVRFEARSRGGSGGNAVVIDEAIELTQIRQD